jgi:hypothetical protein
MKETKANHVTDDLFQVQAELNEMLQENNITTEGKETPLSEPVEVDFRNEPQAMESVLNTKEYLENDTFCSTSIKKILSPEEFMDFDTLHGGEFIDRDTLHGGEFIEKDTLHGGEYIDRDTLHGGEYIDRDTLHGGEFIEKDTLHRGEYIDRDTLHGGEYIDRDTLHGGEFIEKDTLHGGEYIDRDTLHGGEYIDHDTLHSEGWQSISSSRGVRYNYALVKRPNHIDIAIQTPSYGNRSSSALVVHKLPLEPGSPIKKICITKPRTVNTIQKAMGILKEYIDMTDEYIATGKTINQQIKDKLRS